MSFGSMRFGMMLVAALAIFVALGVVMSATREEECEKVGGHVHCDTSYGSDYKGRMMTTQTCLCWSKDGRRLNP